MPVQFVGELPVVRRRRRPRPKLIPTEITSVPKEVRVDRLAKDFEARVAQFNPNTFIRSLSHIARNLGFFQEEEIELRRSARLRGLAPEFSGLTEVKRTRSRKTGAQPDLPDESPIPLEQLLKPYRRTWMESFFAYWGFYSEKEIARRRSLRLQGLDPEFEGLTWGHRRRIRNRERSSRILPFFLGDYHDDDEVFFEYQDHEEGFFQRILDFFLHKIGYLHFEDIEAPIPEEAENVVDEEYIEDDEDLEDDLDYVTIPSESFVDYQQQYEAFENSYNFEATEGFEEDFEEGRPLKLMEESSCLGVLVILVIPLLLLLSAFILDPTELSSVAYQGLQGTSQCIALICTWTGTLIQSIISYAPTTSPKIVHDRGNLNYDALVENILKSDIFQKSVQKMSEKKDLSVEITELIDSRYTQVFEKFKITSKASTSFELKHPHQGISNEINELKSEISNLVNAYQNSLENENMQEIYDRIEMLENKWTQLIAQVDKCCKSVPDVAYVRQKWKDEVLEFVTLRDLEEAVEQLKFDIETSLVEMSKNNVLDILEAKQPMKSNASTLATPQDKSRWEEVQELVHKALLTYGADKTGAFDFALETAGGSVVSTRCTEMYTAR